MQGKNPPNRQLICSDDHHQAPSARRNYRNGWRKAVLFLILAFALTACNRWASGWKPIEVILEAAQAATPTAAITRTPFQAQPPTTRPPTFAPTPTNTPDPIPTETPDLCSNRQPILEQHEIGFTEGAVPAVFRVFLPPCFDPASGVRYPVLYMLHGQTFNDDQWDRLGMDEAAAEMILAGQAPPFIIVMPLESNTFEDIYVSPFPHDLVDGIIPWVDSHYPTCAERTCRAIGGLSRGGAWALRLGFTRWDLFGSIGLHSTPPFIGDPNQFPGWLREIPEEQTPRVWMDTGRSDWFIGSTSQFESLLVEYNVAHEWYLFNGAHDETYWSSHVTDYLEWYTRPWWNPN